MIIRQIPEPVRHDSSTRLAAGELEFYTGDIEGVRFSPLVTHHDERGSLTELYRADDLPFDLLPAMAYMSRTNPGTARGPHEHVEQSDYFAFLGPGDFEVRLWDARVDSPTFQAKLEKVCGESNPCTLLIPPGVVHGYKNIGSTPGWVLNAPNRLYRGPGGEEPVDEIRHEECANSPYKM